MTKEEKVEQPFKVVFAGDSGTGKTNLVARLTNNKVESKSTDGINFDFHQIQVNKRKVKTCIWDLAGAQKYRTMVSSAYHDASGIFLVYDISNRTSFKNTADWLKKIHDYGNSKCVVMLIGNKSDLDKSRVVSTEEAQTFATDNGLLFFETSALKGDNVKLAFRHMVLGPSNSTQKPFHIVLIDIEKAAKREIHCVEKPLEDNLEYVTLSYRWGELQESVADTGLDYIASIKGFDLEDFYSLCKTMGKDPQLKDILYVWVDAICIDQSNYKRRKATIYHMSDIYKQATYIIAVPDLHLQHLRNVSTHNKELMDDICGYSDYMYHLFHGNYQRLRELDEEFLDSIGVPKDPASRKWLTTCTDFFTTGFTKYRVHDVDYEPLKALDHLYETIQASSQSPAPNTTTNSDDTGILQKEEAWRKAFDDEDDYFIDENGDCCSEYEDGCKPYRDCLLEIEDSVHYCNETHCPLDFFYQTGPPWRTSNLLDLMSVRDPRPWNEEIVKRNTLLRQAMQFYMDIIKDWSTRVWVISEYRIAKKKNKLKYWFVQFPGEDLSNNERFWEKVPPSTFSFYKFDFNPAVSITERPHIKRENSGILSDPICQQFHELMIKQLKEQSFLEMILKSNASRINDRFYAVLPISQYAGMLKMVDSWKIKTMVSLKLKLYEWMTTKDKLDLLFISGHNDSIHLYPVSPTFATSAIYWEDVAVKYPPMDYFSSQWINFDMDSDDTITIFPPNDDDGSHQSYLNVKPKEYYMQTWAAKKEYFDDDFPEYETIGKRLQLDGRDDMEIVFIPPFDMDAVEPDMEGTYWFYNGIFLVGSTTKNKWELHKYRNEEEINKDYWLCHQGYDFNHNAGFNIY